MVWMAFSFISRVKASPLIVLAYRPSRAANSSNAAVLYQPALPVRLPEPGLSKITPRVAAPAP